MDKLLEVTYLYDFYGKLLTEKQNKILNYYYLEDLSLSEIAIIQKVSRQSIHETIKQAENKLRSYDEKLGLVNRFIKQDEKIQNINEQLNNINEQINDDGLHKDIIDIKDKMKNLLIY